MMADRPIGGGASTDRAKSLFKNGLNYAVNQAMARPLPGVRMTVREAIRPGETEMTSTTSVAASVVARQQAPTLGRSRTVRVGVVGAGYWGPNLIRNFAALPNTALAMICDLDPTRLHAIGERYPDVALTTNYQDLLDSDV